MKTAIQKLLTSLLTMIKPPNDRDILTKEQVIEYILKNLEEAKNDKENGYENLRTLFEASFGFACDTNLSYDEKADKFVVWEELNFN